MPEKNEYLNLSVIAPAHNERDNVASLREQITRSIDPIGMTYEIVIVDDASTDDTLEVLISLQANCSRLRVIHLEPSSTGRSQGQSAAFKAGIEASNGSLIAMLDADLQNDPADIPGLLACMKARKADLVQGDRSRNRKDSTFKRFGSVVGRIFRRLILGDTVRDTGCSLRVMKREVAEALPLEYRGLHRFIPVTARQMGYIVVELPVAHRPRRAGRGKYGTLSRALPGLIDCLAVCWMRSRRIRAKTVNFDAPTAKIDQHIHIESKAETRRKAMNR